MINNSIIDQDMYPNRPEGIDELKALRQEVAMYRNRLRYLEKWQHEFRGPMNTIIGYPLLMLDDSNLEPMQKEALKAILDGGDSLLQTVQDFFSYIAAEAGLLEANPMPFELQSVITEALQSPQKLAAERNTTLTYEITENVPLNVTGDRKIIRQILTHLCDHSVKSAPNGEVKINIDLSTDQKYLVIKIKDSGAGYKPQDLHQLQRLFARNEIEQEIFDGMELRLVMCKQLCDFVNGALEVESKFKKGSTFTFTIPCQVDIILSS